jgi:hypothetical protein
MKKIIFANVAIGGLAVAVLGLAAPAQTAPAAQMPPISMSASDFRVGVDHLLWLDEIRPKVKVPKVDPSVQVR